jgi:transposase
MRTNTLIKRFIGMQDIVVTNVVYDAELDAIKIQARPPRRFLCRCGKCGRKAKRYDNGQGMRQWRSLDIGATKVFIGAEMPRVLCKEHGVVASLVPWARHGSRFTKDFEEQVCWLAVHSAKTMVSAFMRIDWHTVGGVCNRVYTELEYAAPSRFDGLVNIGIDETSYKKGHKYMTVVVNHDTNAVVWCAKGFGKEVLASFFEQLTPEQRASIRCVSADGARWIADCVTQYCPTAERCIDPFHVVSWATDVLDKIRRQIWTETYREAACAPKRGRGRPQKGEVANPQKQNASAIKNTRYALLKNPENLTSRQQENLEYLVKANPRLYRAYLLKENLRLALKADADEIAAAINKWMAWAQRCRIPEFRALRLKIKRHFNAILAAAKHQLSNARIEAINNKIKLTIRMAFGFRNIDNLLAMVMLRCSNVHPRLPGR